MKQKTSQQKFIVALTGWLQTPDLLGEIEKSYDFEKLFKKYSSLDKQCDWILKQKFQTFVDQLGYSSDLYDAKYILKTEFQDQFEHVLENLVPKLVARIAIDESTSEEAFNFVEMSSKLPNIIKNKILKDHGNWSDATYSEVYSWLMNKEVDSDIASDNIYDFMDFVCVENDVTVEHPIFDNNPSKVGTLFTDLYFLDANEDEEDVVSCFGKIISSDAQYVKIKLTINIDGEEEILEMTRNEFDTFLSEEVIDFVGLNGTVPTRYILSTDEQQVKNHFLNLNINDSNSDDYVGDDSEEDVVGEEEVEQILANIQQDFINLNDIADSGNFINYPFDEEIGTLSMMVSVWCESLITRIDLDVVESDDLVTCVGSLKNNLQLLVNAFDSSEELAHRYTGEMTIYPFDDELSGVLLTVSDWFNAISGNDKTSSTDEPNITFQDSLNVNKYTVSYDCVISGNLIDFSGTYDSISDKFEIDWTSDITSQNYYDANWEDIEEQIQNAFLKKNL